MQPSVIFGWVGDGVAPAVNEELVAVADFGVELGVVWPNLPSWDAHRFHYFDDVPAQRARSGVDPE